MAALVEGDDRICRKLVWLAPSKPDEGAAAEFLARTFLATPWRGTVLEAAHLLDAMSSIKLPDGWEDAVSDPELDTEELVVPACAGVPSNDCEPAPVS
jgi:hypothetical protein